MRPDEGITLEELESQLRDAERALGMPSEAIAAAVARGEMEETEAFHEWSLLYTAWQQSTAARERREGLIEA